MFMRENLNGIEAAFWDAVPDDASVDDFVSGIVINFTYNGKDYSLNTRVLNKPRISPMSTYENALFTAINALIKGDKK
jgi:hypothetical protein